MNRSAMCWGCAMVAAGGVLAGGVHAQTICGTWEIPPALNGPVAAIVEFQGETYLGGQFSGQSGNYVTRWNGSSYLPLAQQLPQQVTSQQVTSLIVYDDGTGPALYAGGHMWTFGPFPNQTHHGVVKWNGQSWNGTGFPVNGGTISDMAVYDDGQGPALYATGTTSTTPLWRWDGSSWAHVPGAPPARTLAVFDDGGGPALYLGGSFSTAGGVPAKNIAMLRQGVWSEVGGGLYFNFGLLSEVGCLEALDLGQGPRLFAGGAFNRAGEVPARFVASWDGTSWTAYPFTGYSTFQYTSPTITSFAVLRNVQPPLLLVGATLLSSYPGGALRGGLLVWDGERWFSAGAPAESGVHAILPYDDPKEPKALLGGWMPGSVALAEWTPCPQCYANCDWSTNPPLLNVNDFVCFQQKFAAGDLWANCDASTAQPILNVNDFVCFQQRFVAGCN